MKNPIRCFKNNQQAPPLSHWACVEPTKSALKISQFSSGTKTVTSTYISTSVRMLLYQVENRLLRSQPSKPPCCDGGSWSATGSTPSLMPVPPEVTQRGYKYSCPAISAD